MANSSQVRLADWVVRRGLGVARVQRFLSGWYSGDAPSLNAGYRSLGAAIEYTRYVYVGKKNTTIIPSTIQGTGRVKRREGSRNQGT